MQSSFNLILYAVVIICAVSCAQNGTNKNELELKQKDTVNRNIIGTSEGQVQKFDISIGKKVNGFHYNSNGTLTYNEKSFTPSITANKANVPKFNISMLLSEEIAGAIAIDVDGQNFLFFLNLQNYTATPMQPTNSWNAAQEIYWSPTKTYMVAHCVYEGESFISLNTQTKKIVKMESLKPGKNYETIWTVESEPKWLTDKDVLTFKVAEYCNPYEVDCSKNGDSAIARYNVNLNAKTLQIVKE